MSELNIFTLGPPRIELDGSTVNIHERKAVALLIYLVVSGESHSRDAMSTMLWPEFSQSRAHANMRHALWSIKEAGLGEFIFKEQENIKVPPPFWLDVLEFDKYLDEHRKHDHAPGEVCVICIDSLTNAFTIYKDEFLAGFTLRDAPQFDDWQFLQREHWRQLFGYTLDCLARWHGKLGDWTKAIEFARRRVALEPLNEHSHRDLMHFYVASGKKPLALKQFDKLSMILNEELGIAPEEETVSLFDAIRLGQYSKKSFNYLSIGINPKIFESIQLNPPKFLETSETAIKNRNVFVAREAELKVLDEHLDSALSGSGRIIFIAGEAGSGKTSLMTEFARQAASVNKGLIWVKGICNAYFGSGDPYLPFRSILAALAGDLKSQWRSGDLPDEMVRRIWASIPRFINTLLAEGPDLLDVFIPIEEINGFLSEYSSDRYTWQKKLEEVSRRRKFARESLVQPQLFEETARVLNSFSTQNALLLIIDDLQWVDRASASLLFHLGRHLSTSRILILCGYRASEVALGYFDHGSGQTLPHPMEQLINEFEISFGNPRVDLEKIGTQESYTFLGELIDSEPNILGDDFRKALFKKTRGQPLFTIELLRDLQEQGYLILDGQGRWVLRHDLDWKFIPVRVEAVIEQRFGRLNQELLQLLSVASVEGEEFTAQVACQILGLDIKWVLSQLSWLENRTRLVREQGESRIGGRILMHYQFGHALFQWYLYQNLSQGEQRWLHGEVAYCLENLYGQDMENIVPQLAHHYFQAGDQEKAAPYLVKSGDLAYRRAALDEALKFYSEGLALWPRSDPKGRADGLNSQGICMWLMDETERALQVFNEAYSLYKKVNDLHNAAIIQRWIGTVHRSRGERELALKHIHQALDIFQHLSEREELARTYAEIARIYMGDSNYDQAIDLGDQAFELAKKIEAEDIVAHTLTTLGVSHMALGDVDKGLSMLEESLERALELGQPDNVCRVYFNLGESLLAHTMYKRAVDTFQAAIAYANTTHAFMYKNLATVWLSYINWLIGKWDISLALISQQKEIILHEEVSKLPVEWKLWGSTKIGQMLNDLGQPEKASLLLEKWLPLIRQDSDFQTVVPHLGELLRSKIAMEKEEEIQSLLNEFLDWYKNSAYFYVTGLVSILYFCYWCIKSNNPGNIERIKSCIRLFEKVDMQFHTLETAACLQESYGCLKLAMEAPLNACKHFQKAVENWEEINRPFDQLRTRIELGKTMKFLGRDDEASIILGKGVDIAQRLADQLPEETMKLSFWNSATLKILHNR